MIFQFIMALVFLLLPLNVYGSATVDVYGDYDFTKRELSVFWKGDNAYSSYRIELYALPMPPNDSCTYENSGVLAITKISSTPEVVFTNIGTLTEPTRCRVCIYGVANNTTSSVLWKQEFSIYLLTTKYELEWELCPPPIEYKYTGVYLNSTMVPGFTFNTSKFIEGWETSKVIEIDEYNQKKYMVLTSIGQLINTPDVNTAESSPPSAIIISYASLPIRPEWEGVK